MARLLTRLQEAHNNMTTIFTILVPSTLDGRLMYWWRYGRVTLSRALRELHLYDAFSMQSQRVLMPEPLSRLCWTWEGVKVRLMTCYDLRFPDMALAAGG